MSEVSPAAQQPAATDRVERSRTCLEKEPKNLWGRPPLQAVACDHCSKIQPASQAKLTPETRFVAAFACKRG